MATEVNRQWRLRARPVVHGPKAWPGVYKFAFKNVP